MFFTNEFDQETCVKSKSFYSSGNVNMSEKLLDATNDSVVDTIEDTRDVDPNDPSRLEIESEIADAMLEDRMYEEVANSVVSIGVSEIELCGTTVSVLKDCITVELTA